MKSDLSIDHEKNEISLKTNKSDTTAFILKAVLGAVPYLGSVLQEVVSTIIPNQKVERIKLFAEVLAQKIEHLEKDFVQTTIKSEEFTDLLEDALHQASRALSKERVEYIASFLKNSLTDKEIEHLEKKKLLSTLGELNDIEVIWLKYSSYRTINAVVAEKRNEFYEKHKNILRPISIRKDSSNLKQMGKYEFQNSYIQNLVRLNLVNEDDLSNKKNRRNEFDIGIELIKVNDIYVTALGILLLKYIDGKENFPN